MSGAADRDILAGEYALGVLEGAELVEAEHLMASDPDFARAVDVWRERLNPLARLAAPSAPPKELWARIEASIDADNAARPRMDNLVPFRRLNFWRGAAIGSMALAASLAAFIWLRRPEPPGVAVLAPIAGGTPVLVATLGRSGTLTIRPNGSITVPAGRDLELWSLSAGETQPRSLGVLPAEGKQVTARLSPGTQLLVSLEPRGGSPTGQPTGPVLYGGTVTVMN